MTTQTPSKTKSEVKKAKVEAPKTTETRRTVIPDYRVLRAEDKFEVLVTLPGVNEGNLDVQLENQWVKVKGSPTSLDMAGFSCIHEEFATPDYECEFKIPSTTDPEKIDAKLTNGILTLTLPKAAEHAPRNIRVSAS